MSDGLTVPFALAAGLSGAVDNTSIIVTAGVAEIAAGSIAMGLGGYLAARSDAEHYQAERARKEIEVKEKAGVEAEEVSDIFRSYGLTAAESQVLVDALRKRPDSVSTPRSSNRTGGFPASGFRTRTHAFAHGKSRVRGWSSINPSSWCRYSLEKRAIPSPRTLCLARNH
jgi:VIT family protein